MISKSEILDKLRELKPVLSKDYSVRKIGLFGSYAIDNANDDSDIDLLVELDRPIGWRFFSLEIYLEQIFGRKIDLVTKSALRNSIKEDILSTVITFRLDKGKHSYLMYLEDIQVSMSRIAEYIGDLDYISFKRDYKTVDAVIRNFEIIGEASKNLPDHIKEKYELIP